MEGGIALSISSHHSSYHDRIDAPGPKRLLALDGGGIRGVLTLEVLARMEHMLRTELRRGPDFMLGDYFDYVAGTSTGAIIAAGLATGMSVTHLQDIYREHGRQMFDRAALWDMYLSLYDSSPLADLLQQEFGATTQFGDEDAYRCLLMMVLRNATTDSPWPLSNTTRHMAELRAVGEAVARQVVPAHFDGFLNDNEGTRLNE